jgi:hypothetical protein
VRAGLVPFDAGARDLLRSVASLMSAAAALAVVSGLLTLAANILKSAVAGGTQVGSSIAANLCSGFVGLAITALLSFFLIRSALALKSSLRPDGADQGPLADSLGHLRNYFLTKGLLIIIGLVLGALCCGGTLLAGAAFLSR